jgi:hypothetical protein
MVGSTECTFYANEVSGVSQSEKAMQEDDGTVVQAQRCLAAQVFRPSWRHSALQRLWRSAGAVVSAIMT